MKISYNWLKQYIDIDKDPLTLSEILTNIGLEVEGMEEWVSVEGGLEGIVIGQVLECSQHPNADKLSLTKVDIGTGIPLSIVCGAPNVAAGQKVAVATIGTKLSFGDNELIIKKSKIRGELSEGMICAEDEMGIGSSHDGIMVLGEAAQIGTPASEYFTVEKDTVFEIGLTPNRIDGGSHYGVARDLAAYFNQENKCSAIKPDISGFKPDNNSLHIPVSVENTRDCPRYTGITISNLKVDTSPQWLQNRLRAIGLSPINNVVDITNYVLHEMGQPLHAFDADRIKGGRVIVKNLAEKTKFTTLDEVERELSANDLMICDADGGMCIGGVFGGISSGVSWTTKNIFLESAYFNPVSIRKTARRHDLNTDASFRFERGADPNITTWSLVRAALMIKEIAGGEISSDIVDEYPFKIENQLVNVSYANITRLTGKEIDKAQIKSILESLDIKVTKEDKSGIIVEVPAYRVDVNREADVIEEILRIYGYNNIEVTEHVNSTLSYTEKPDRERLINTISDMLSGFGFMEIMSNSLTRADLYTNNPDFNEKELVLLANPLSSDLNAMRQTLLYGGLSALERNINRQNNNLRFYEFGTCYFLKDPLKKDVFSYSEKLSLDLFVSGDQVRESWNTKASPSDFFFLKASVDMVLEKLGINIDLLAEEECGLAYFSEGLNYLLGKRIISSFGRISRKLLKQFDLKQDIFYASIDWDFAVEQLKSKKQGFTELPKFPSVRRDLALLLDSGIKFNSLRDLAFKTEKDILRKVALFDVYEDESLGENKKSYALSFILRDDKRTLTDKMIDRVMSRLAKEYEKEFGAIVR
jgi:phenylalanyl-tRNA synthetase beta chain